MAHSDEQEPLLALLIVAPTGVYSGRVRQGIDLIIGQYADKQKTKTGIDLIASANWAADPTYKAEFVEKVREHVMKTWKESAEYNVVCEDCVVSMEEEEFLTGWLLERVCKFFKTHDRARTFIDLTAGPKEWLMAAMNVANVFSKVELYNVAPKFKKGPGDYDKEEVNDPGIPKLDSVATSGVALARWVRPTDEDGKVNSQHQLFQTIFRMAQSLVSSKHSPQELTRVWVPIEEERGLEEYRASLPSGSRKQDNSTFRKSISKNLTSVQPFRLFEIKGKSVRMTYRAAMLALALFAANQSEA